MGKQEKTTAVIGLIVIIVICLIILTVAVAYIINNGGFANKSSNALESAATDYLNSIADYAIFTDGSKLYIEQVPQSESALKLYYKLQNTLTYDINAVSVDHRDGSSDVIINCTDFTAFKSGLSELAEIYLSEKVKSATAKTDIYNSDLTYRSDLLNDAITYAVDNIDPASYRMSVASKLIFRKSGGWKISNAAVPETDFDNIYSDLVSSVCAEIPYIQIVYKIDENAKAGSVTDPYGWGETEDPAVISELIARPEAQLLIGDEKLAWNPDIEFIEGRKIRYYLDESILMIQWQQTEAQTVGTYCEVFISDGSQLRRKIAGDTFGDMNFETTTDFAVDTNAVLALGGDFYNHARACGICVYERNIYRFDNLTCDNCYITTDGDMLFSYRGQFSTIEEAQTFVEENDILYSLCFGPVLVDDGVDVTPTSYPWGEIDDTYARSCLGMLGRHHYLTLNMNCQLPYHWYLATLRSAADAMIRYGCYKVYTLDGGQTATTAVNGELINPVQFGKQKEISDIIYFCSSVPR